MKCAADTTWATFSDKQRGTFNMHCPTDIKHYLLTNLHVGYSFQLAVNIILYAPSHRQDDT